MFGSAVRILLLLGLSIPGGPVPSNIPSLPKEPGARVELLVLGTIQDGGSPHIGCNRACCADLFRHPDLSRKGVALGIIDHNAGKTFLLEAGPDLPSQLQILQRETGSELATPSGIFVTHAHIGHYGGLMYLGREALNAALVPVFAMPRMMRFLSENGPWSQLVGLGNISLQPLVDSQPLRLTAQLEIVPFTVPHRDEFSETVGFEIRGPGKTVLFIPDIDKWSRWQVDIADRLRNADLAFLDATFYSGAEIGYRDMAEIPHPFVVESMGRFDSLPSPERQKIRFIHLNHTNPLLDPASDEARSVQGKGYGIAHFGERFEL